METISPDEIKIKLDIKGANRYEKVSFPIRYGSYSEIETDNFVFQFNLTGEIKYILGKNTFQIEPAEWLKRTLSNDWVFYSSGGYNGAIQTVGEHYVPCFQYQSNAVTGGNPFKAGFLDSALSGFSALKKVLTRYQTQPLDTETSAFIETVLRNGGENLARRALEFHSITEGAISVLPPDTRHVDYDVIPVNISTGCLYDCRFCSVKTGTRFRIKEKSAIKLQIERLNHFYNADIKNFNSLFLGQHDALFAGAELIEYAALTAMDIFKLSTSNIRNPRLFLFGSADSLIKTEDHELQRINSLPFDIYINIGFESFDDATLVLLGKPVSAKKMKLAFRRMLEINRRYPKIEISANILIGEKLPESHYKTFSKEAAEIPPGNSGKGVFYISPLESDYDRKKIMNRFKIMKKESRLPAFLYLIQRL